MPEVIQTETRTFQLIPGDGDCCTGCVFLVGFTGLSQPFCVYTVGRIHAERPCMQGKAGIWKEVVTK
jgi:hypothetical protein